MELHKLKEPFVFDDIEWQQILTLGLGRRFSLFVPIEPQASLVNKIEQLFQKVACEC